MLSSVVTRMRETVNSVKTNFHNDSKVEKRKRKRLEEVQEEDEDCIITDVIQTPPVKRQKSLKGADGRKTFIRTISDFFKSMSWSDRYFWSPTSKKGIEQPRERVLQVDLTDAENQKENYVRKETERRTFKQDSHIVLGEGSQQMRPIQSGHAGPLDTYDMIIKTPAHKSVPAHHFIGDDLILQSDELGKSTGDISMNVSYVEKKALPKARPSSIEKNRRGDVTRCDLGASIIAEQEAFSSTRPFRSWKHSDRTLPSFRRNTSRTTILATEEIIRIEERNKYQELLAHVTGCEFPDPTPINNSRLLKSFSQSVIRDSSPLRHNVNHSRSFESSSLLTPGLSLLPAPSPLKYTPPHHSSPPVIKMIPSPSKTPSVKPSQQRNITRNMESVIQQKKQLVQDVVDLTSPKESTKISTVSIRSPESPVVSQFLNGDWTKKWRETLDPKELERQRRIRSEERKREALKARKEKEIEELEKQFKKQIDDEEGGDSFPELTDEMEEQVEDAWSTDNATIPVVEGFRIPITKADLATLKDATWLNDEVINFYMNLIMDRSKQKNYPNVYVFNTFFYSTLIKQGYVRVKRWTKKVDIFSMDLIIAPIHLEYHWCLAVIDFRKKCIYYYDSLRGKNPKCLTALRQYLQEESKDKKKTPFDLSGWTEQSPQDVPQQLNGCDCGVFACKYAEYISIDSPFNFSQEHMPYFRRRMVYEILNKTLL